MLALFVDLVAPQKEGAHEWSVREAVRGSSVWVAASMAFYGRLWWAVAQDHGLAMADPRALELLAG